MVPILRDVRAMLVVQISRGGIRDELTGSTGLVWGSFAPPTDLLRVCDLQSWDDMSPKV